MRLITSRRLIACLPGALLVAAAVLQPWLEATMARHMGLEFPLLFVIGWLTASAAGPRLARFIASWNAKGLTALVFTALVTGFWMVPAALDLAVQHPGVGLLKVLSWLVAGMLMGASWRQAGAVIQAFFIFNWCWITLAVGLIYQEAPQQLCSVYLVYDQWNAGASMIFWAIAVFLLWLPGVIKSSNLLGDNDDSPKVQHKS